MANTILEAVAQQARAMTSVLIVADDIDAEDVLPRHHIIRLRDVVTVNETANLALTKQICRSRFSRKR